MNILLSCIGKRGYIADCFREILPAGSKIIGTSNTAWTPGFSSCDFSLILPPIASDEYVPVLLNECRKREVSGLLSLFDPDVHKISAHRKEFFEAGIIPVIPELAASTIAFDKQETWRFLSALGIAVPLTTESLSQAKIWLESGALKFPLVIKPRYGFGSTNTFTARNVSELDVFYLYAPGMIIQQFMDAESLNVDGLGDLKARPVTVVPWRKLLSRMGETERSVTIECPELVGLAERLIREVGIIGPFDADFFRDSNGKLWVLELNPRFGGGYPVSHLAGANFPDLIIRLIRGEPVERNKRDYKRGVTMMKRLQIIPGPPPLSQ
ncbi:MAG: ATP-grasp domain-containing protein [Methylophilaceae bacterium]|nr:ATP-grasp domain-containing protein [Methylophilaceae bacterium]